MPAVPNDPPIRAPNWRALIQTSLNISRSLELAEIFSNSLRGIQQFTQSELGCFVLIKPDAHALQIAQATTMPPAVAAQFDALAHDATWRAHLAPHASASDLIYALGERVRAVLRAHAIDEYILLPLTARGAAIGVLLAGLKTAAPLEPLSVDSLMAVGEQIGMAIENARLHEQIRESEEWHRAFIENSVEGFWEGDFADRILYINDAACAMIGGDRATILQMPMSQFAADTWEERRDAGIELRQTGILRAHRTKLRRLDGRIVTVNFTTRLVRDANGNPTRYQTILRDVTEEQATFDTLQHRNAELGALNQIAEILSHSLASDHALHEVCEQITTITGLETAVIDLLDESRQELRIAGWHGLSGEMIRVSQHLGLDDAVTRQIAIDGQVIALDDLQNYPGEGFAGPRAEGYRAGIAVPIRRGDTPLGILIVGSKSKTAYERSDVDLLCNIANQIGGALENVELLAQMQLRIAELDGLAQLSAACASGLDPQTVIASTLYWTQTLLNVDGTDVRMVNADQLVAVPDGTRGIHLDPDQPITLVELRVPLIENHIPVVVKDFRTDPTVPEHVRAMVEAAGIRAMLVAPLIAQDRVIGTLAAIHGAPRDWSAHDIELLQTIANQSANAMDNANLFQTVSSEKRKVQAIFDSGLSGLYVTDAAGNLTMLNRAAERITGWSARDALAKSWDALFAPGNTNPAESVISQVRATRETIYIPDGRKIRKQSGEEIPVAEAGAPLFDEQGNLTGIVGAFWDLTREEQAEKMRERFLARFAHQLRSPLTTIISGLELLGRHKLVPARHAATWAYVKGESERLRRFAHQFLDLEGAFTESRKIECGRVDLEPVIAAAVLRARAETHTHQFRVKLAHPVPVVLADANFLEHILFNLLDNAIRYAPSKSRITISAKPFADEWVELAVQDQGPGIPLAEQDLIFQEYYRGKNRVHRAYGHGLGLAIVREMVTAMDGRVWVESREGQGATFRFTVRRTQ